LFICHSQADTLDFIGKVLHFPAIKLNRKPVMSSIKNAFLSTCVLLIIVVFDGVKEWSGSRAMMPKTVLGKSLIEESNV
jgi:hypothetical protein